MKKVLKVFSVMLVSILLFGCGEKNSKEFVKTCEMTSNDPANGYKLSSVYKIYGTSNVVDKVVTTETVESEDEETLDYFKEYLSTTYDTYNKAYGGYKNEIKKSEGELISETTIDYSKMDLEKYIEDNSAMKNYVNSDNQLLLEGVISIYESLGATCK